MLNQREKVDAFWASVMVVVLLILSANLSAAECYDDDGTQYSVPQGKKFVFIAEHVEAQWCLVGEAIMHPEPEPDTKKTDVIYCDEQEDDLDVSPSYCVER